MGKIWLIDRWIGLGWGTEGVLIWFFWGEGVEGKMCVSLVNCFGGKYMMSRVKIYVRGGHLF